MVGQRIRFADFENVAAFAQVNYGGGMDAAYAVVSDCGGFYFVCSTMDAEPTTTTVGTVVEVIAVVPEHDDDDVDAVARAYRRALTSMMNRAVAN